MEVTWWSSHKVTCQILWPSRLSGVIYFDEYSSIGFQATFECSETEQLNPSTWIMFDNSDQAPQLYAHFVIVKLQHGKHYTTHHIGATPGESFLQIPMKRSHKEDIHLLKNMIDWFSGILSKLVVVQDHFYDIDTSSVCTSVPMAD